VLIIQSLVEDFMGIENSDDFGDEDMVGLEVASGGSAKMAPVKN